MIDQAKAFLLENRSAWNLPAGGEWTFFLYNNYQPQGCYLNLLWFHNGSRFPLAVTKLCRDEWIIRREFENLTQAHPCAPKIIPKPLSLGREGEFWTLWMEGVPGSPLLPRDYSPSILTSLAETVAAMHVALRTRGERPGPNRYRRMVADPFQSLTQFGDDERIAVGVKELQARISQEWFNSLPAIPQHGDLFPGNLLWNRGEWHVLDWESFGTIDLPAYDLMTFLISFLLEGTPGQWDPGLVRQVPGLINCYVRQMELSLADVSLLLPLVLANWFHLQWTDGRKPFADRMYRFVGHYFRVPRLWEEIFLGPRRVHAPQQVCERSAVQH